MSIAVLLFSAAVIAYGLRDQATSVTAIVIISA